MEFRTKEVLTIIEGLDLEELKELTKAQHDSSGNRTGDPLVSVRKDGKFNVYTFSDLMLIYLYRCSKYGLAEKNLFRLLYRVPNEFDRFVGLLRKEHSGQYDLQTEYNPFRPNCIVQRKESILGQEVLTHNRSGRGASMSLHVSHLGRMVKLKVDKSAFTYWLNFEFKQPTKEELESFGKMKPILQVSFDLDQAHRYLKDRIYKLGIR